MRQLSAGGVVDKRQIDAAIAAHQDMACEARTGTMDSAQVQELELQDF